MGEYSTKVAYSGRFVQVKEVVIDGHVWEKAYFPDSLVVFPFTSGGEVIMIEEKRPHEKKPSRLKFVTGHIHGEESPITTANREMMEEIGFEARELKEFLKHESSGTINSNFHFIAARGLSPKKIPNPDGEETILAIKPFSLRDLEKALYEERMDWTISALGLFKILRRVKEGGLDSLFE